jgi:hypothetical protein
MHLSFHGQFSFVWEKKRENQNHYQTRITKLKKNVQSKFKK